MWLDVFNTECHPFKAAPASGDTIYGTGSTATSNSPYTPVEGDLPSVSGIAGIPDKEYGPLAKVLGII